MYEFFDEYVTVEFFDDYGKHMYEYFDEYGKHMYEFFDEFVTVERVLEGVLVDPIWKALI